MKKKYRINKERVATLILITAIIIFWCYSMKTLSGQITERENTVYPTITVLSK